MPAMSFVQKFTIYLFLIGYTLHGSGVGCALCDKTTSYANKVDAASPI